jgi:hypothetical protein
LSFLLEAEPKVWKASCQCREPKVANLSVHRNW